ncbi:uncharacterized protein LOC144153272 [Haemaphysalis longicornis]
MRWAGWPAVALACLAAAGALAQAQVSPEQQRPQIGLPLPEQAQSHLERDPERFDFFGENREEQCQDDLDCDRKTGRVCARKPNDAAGHCRCPPDKPNKDSQGQCQPPEQQGCQQNTDCGKPFFVCIEKQCQCVPPNVFQADGSCKPPQNEVPPPAKSTWLSPLAFLFAILLLMTCTVFVTRYRKDEDAMDEDEISEGGTGACRRSWSGAKGGVDATSSAARLQPKTSPLGPAVGYQGSLEQKLQLEPTPVEEQAPPPGGEVVDDVRSRQNQIMVGAMDTQTAWAERSPTDGLVVQASPTVDNDDFRPVEVVSSAYDTKPALPGDAQLAHREEIEAASRHPEVQREHSSGAAVAPISVNRSSSDDIRLPEFVRSPTQQVGDVGWPGLVPEQRIRRGLEMLRGSPRRGQLQHFLDGRDLFDREEEPVSGDQLALQQQQQQQQQLQQLQQLQDALCCKTVQTDISLAPAIVPFAVLDTVGGWSLPPSRMGGPCKTPMLTIDSGDYDGGRRSTAGLGPGSSELFLPEQLPKPQVTDDSPLVHQGIGGGMGATSSNEPINLPSPAAPRSRRTSGEGPSSRLHYQPSERSEDARTSPLQSLLSSPVKNKSRYSIPHTPSDDFGSSRHSTENTTNKMAPTGFRPVAGASMHPIEEASCSVDPTSEPPSELMAAAQRPYHGSTGPELGSQEGWARRLRAPAPEEDASVSFQSFEVEAQVGAHEQPAAAAVRTGTGEERASPVSENH